MSELSTDISSNPHLITWHKYNWACLNTGVYVGICLISGFSPRRIWRYGQRASVHSLWTEVCPILPFVKLWDPLMSIQARTDREGPCAHMHCKWSSVRKDYPSVQCEDAGVKEENMKWHLRMNDIHEKKLIYKEKSLNSLISSQQQ